MSRDRLKGSGALLQLIEGAISAIAADVQHFFVQKVGIGVDYWYERFNTADFNTVDLPGQPGVPQIYWLGEINTGYGNRPYRGQTVFVRLLYLF